jgi:hypothetical protein
MLASIQYMPFQRKPQAFEDNILHNPIAHSRLPVHATDCRGIFELAFGDSRALHHDRQVLVRVLDVLVLGYDVAIPPEEPPAGQKALHPNRAPGVYSARADSHLEGKDEMTSG